MVEMEEERLRMREHVMNEVCNLIQGPYIYRTVLLLTHIKKLSVHDKI